MQQHNLSHHHLEHDNNHRGMILTMSDYITVNYYRNNDNLVGAKMNMIYYGFVVMRKNHSLFMS